ncbi:MAG: sensor histidine kinase, partial [Syntrophales bacterium]|nr:sensor histidine kinase [Syntrophales bacterium]
IDLDIDTVIPCALIVNELVSNALKHAFPEPWRGREAGEIAVDLRRDTAGRLTLTVSDNGVGLSEGFAMERCESLGLKLVGALVKQLQGAIRLETDGGTRFAITFEARK